MPDDHPDDDQGERPRARKRKRRTQPRPKRIAVKKLTKSVIAAGWADLGGREARARLSRPRTWSECGKFIDACPFVGCRHHNFLDVNAETGTITMNHPHRDPLDLVRPCSLAVAMRGGLTLDEVGEVLNLTRERIRQLEIVALIKMKRGAHTLGIE